MRAVKKLGSAAAVAAFIAWHAPAIALDAAQAQRIAQRAIVDAEANSVRIRTAMGRAAAQDDPSRRLAAADLLLRNRDYDRAAAAFSEIVERHRNHPAAYAEALFNLGETFHRSNQDLSARRTFLRVVDESSTNVRLVPYRAPALARLTDIAIRTRNVVFLDQVLQLMRGADDGAVASVMSYARGRALLHKGDIPAARSSLQRVGAQSPLHHQARYLLGVAALKEARLSADGGSPQATGAAKRGRYAGAIEAFRQVTRLPPDTPEHRHVIDLSWMAIGRLQLDSDQLAAAAEAYNHVDRDSPEFGTMLYELATTYVQIGDVPRAQRALEVLAVLNPDSEDVAAAGLLRGDLQLRSGQFRKARESFEAVQNQFDPMGKQVDHFLASTNDPAVYYERLIQEQLDILEAGAALPPVAIRWARQGEDGPEAFAVVDEVVETRKLLRQSEHLIDRLTVVMSSPNRIHAFADLEAGEQTALGVINGLTRGRGAIGQGLDDVESSSVPAEMASVRNERRDLQARVLQLPVTPADFQQREQAAIGQWNRVSQKVQQLELQVNTLQAVVNALQRVLSESAARGIARDPASTRRLQQELEENIHDIEVYRQRMANLRRLVEHGKITAGFQELGGDERDLRERYKRLLAQEVQMAAGGSAGSGAAQYAALVRPLLARADAAEANAEAARAEIARRLDVKVREMNEIIDAERRNIMDYLARLDLLDEEARLVVGQVAMRNLGLVRDRLKAIVLHADVGITEEAWEVREEQLRRVRSLQSERARTDRLLNEELREVLDDMVDE